MQLSVSQVGERLIRSCPMDVGEAERKPEFSDCDAPSKCYGYRSILRLSFARCAHFDEDKQHCRGTWRMLLTCIGGEAAPIWVPVLLHLQLYRLTTIVGVRH